MDRKIRVCPICGKTEKIFLYRNTMAALGDIDLSYTIVACARCHSVFADEIASREEYEKYYSLYSKYDTGGTPSQETCMIHEKLVNIVSKYFDEPICGVVDIGCGSGNLLATFGKRFQHIALIGIDPSPETAYHRLKNFKHVEINKGFIENVDVVNRECNVFCLTAVLEHLENPFAALLALSERLSERDCLAIEVPDILYFDGRDGEPYGEFSLEHINYFSIESLSQLLERAGFTVIASETLRFKSCGSLLLLARKKEGSLFHTINDKDILKSYVEQSEFHWKQAVEARINSIFDTFWIFGAGSHTAKLIGRYEDIFSKFCIGILNNNKNLHGVTMGNCTIVAPTELPRKQDVQVLISSFKAECALESELRKIRPSAEILKIYS